MLKAILTASLLLAACTDTVEPPRGPEYLAIPAPHELVPESTKVIVRDLKPANGVAVHAPESLGFELETSPCDCTTAECIQSWVVDNIGCGIEVDLVCPDGPRGAYAKCDAGQRSI